MQSGVICTIIVSYIIKKLSAKDKHENFFIKCVNNNRIYLV